MEKTFVYFPKDHAEIVIGGSAAQLLRKNKTI